MERLPRSALHSAVRTLRVCAVIISLMALAVAPSYGHPLCSITAVLDVTPNPAADGAALAWNVRFCNQTAAATGLVHYAYFTVDPSSFVPSSAAWTSCPTNNCLSADGVLWINAFALQGSQCLGFDFTLRLQPGQRGKSVGELGTVRTQIAGSPIPCDGVTDDPKGFPQSTRVTVEDPAPSCILTPIIAPTSSIGCAGVPVQLSAAGSGESGCPGGSLGYQWLRQGLELSGENAVTYTVPASAPPSADRYRCRVSCLGLPECVSLTNPVQVFLLGPSGVAAPDTVCANSPVDVSVPDGATCTIACGNGTPVINSCQATCTWAGPGPYTITATATDDGGCSANMTRTVGIIPPPVACIAPVGPICQDRAVGPTPIKLGNCSPQGVSYAWTTDGGSFDFPNAPEPILSVDYVTALTSFNLGLDVSAAGCGGASHADRVFDVYPAPPALKALRVVKGPGADELTLVWEPESGAPDGFDVWTVAKKSDIPFAQKPGGAGRTQVCGPVAAPGCTHAGGLGSAAGPVLYYQAHGVCGSLEGF